MISLQMDIRTQVRSIHYNNLVDIQEHFIEFNNTLL